MRTDFGTATTYLDLPSGTGLLVRGHDGPMDLPAVPVPDYPIAGAMLSATSWAEVDYRRSVRWLTAVGFAQLLEDDELPMTVGRTADGRDVIGLMAEPLDPAKDHLDAIDQGYRALAEQAGVELFGVGVAA